MTYSRGVRAVGVRIRGKSYFCFETLPPPLRGPPPSTEGGKFSFVALTRRGRRPRRPVFEEKQLLF